MALKDDGAIRRDGTLNRKQAVSLLGMNDTEFALRLVWDSNFPKAVAGGCFREADIVAWMNAQRGGETGNPCAARGMHHDGTRYSGDGACGLRQRAAPAPAERPRSPTVQKGAEKTVS